MDITFELWNSGGFKYNVILIDGQTHKIVDIIRCRHKHYLAEYFKGFKQEESDKVKVLKRICFGMRNFTNTIYTNYK